MQVSFNLYLQVKQIIGKFVLLVSTLLSNG